MMLSEYQTVPVSGKNKHLELYCNLWSQLKGSTGPISRILACMNNYHTKICSCGAQVLKNTGISL